MLCSTYDQFRHLSRSRVRNGALSAIMECHTNKSTDRRRISQTALFGLRAKASGIFSAFDFSVPNVARQGEHLATDLNKVVDPVLTFQRASDIRASVADNVRLYNLETLELAR